MCVVLCTFQFFYFVCEDIYNPIIFLSFQRVLLHFISDTPKQDFPLKLGAQKEQKEAFSCRKAREIILAQPQLHYKYAFSRNNSPNNSAFFILPFYLSIGKPHMQIRRGRSSYRHRISSKRESCREGRFAVAFTILMEI